MICDGSFPTSNLTHWTRDRTRGPKLAARAHGQDADARHRRGASACTTAACSRPATRRPERDRLRPAARCTRREVAYDLPAGGRRLVQRADGYVATIVAGQITYRDGEPTGALPGRLVRGASRPRQERSVTARARDRSCEWTADDMRDPALWTERADAARARRARRRAARRAGEVRRPARDRHGRLPAAARAARGSTRIEHELDRRPRLRAPARHRPRARYDNDEMCLIYWGIGAHLGKPWPQNTQGPRARRRHRPGQGARRSDRARQRARRRRACRSTATARTSSASCACEPGAEGGLSRVANSVVAAQPARARAPRARRRALRAAARTTTAASSRRAASRFYFVPVLHRVGRPPLRAPDPAVHPRVAAPRRRAAPHATPQQRGARLDDRRWPRAGRYNVDDGLRARRHAVHQQLPRAARPHARTRTTAPRQGAPPEAALARDRRATRRGRRTSRTTSARTGTRSA